MSCIRYVNDTERERCCDEMYDVIINPSIFPWHIVFANKLIFQIFWWMSDLQQIRFFLDCVPNGANVWLVIFNYYPWFRCQMFIYTSCWGDQFTWKNILVAFGNNILLTQFKIALRFANFSFLLFLSACFTRINKGHNSMKWSL